MCYLAEVVYSLYKDRDPGMMGRRTAGSTEVRQRIRLTKANRSVGSALRRFESAVQA